MNTDLLYFVMKTKWTWSVEMQCLPWRSSFSVGIDQDVICPVGVLVFSGMLVGRRFRLYPTRVQEEKMLRYCGARRFVYNLALEQREFAFKLTGRSPRFAEQCRQLKELRLDPEVACWLRIVPVQVLQQALRDLDGSFQRFFKGLAGYPCFKRKWCSESFRVPQHVEVRKLSRKWAEGGCLFFCVSRGGFV